MFGSNFPVDRLFSSFDRLYGAYFEITAGFSDDEKAMLFADNAKRFYRLGNS
jgi:predicted TIM-barrel fold metal-dependent hydrolase